MNNFDLLINSKSGPKTLFRKVQFSCLKRVLVLKFALSYELNKYFSKS